MQLPVAKIEAVPATESRKSPIAGIRRVSAEEAIPYLIGLGLLSHRDVMRDDIRVEDASRRNRNLKVISSRGPSFFLKQPDSSDRSTLEGIDREARHYRTLADQPERSIQRLFPTLFHYDAERIVLVLEAIPFAISLGQYLDANAAAPQPAMAAAAGRAIAAFQRVRPPDRVGTPKNVETPWALRFTFPGPELLQIASLGQIEMIRIVQKNGDAWNAIAAMRNEYRGDCLVHGDLRWDNLLTRPGTPGARPRLWVIDWELADAGDPAWDVGSAFAGFLARCVCYMQPGSEINPRSLSKAFVAQLAAAQLEIRAFWKAYLKASANARFTPDVFLRRCALFCGARLLQIAFEWSPGQTLTPVAACFLQLGLNLMRRPDDAPSVVFRIPERGA